MICLAIPTLAATAQAAPAGDVSAGERLHAANCTSCHDTGVYTRKDRRVGSLDALNAQFQSCSHMTKKEFTPTEVRDLTKFLNDRFYRFK
jgi:cytochrome c553